MRVTIVVSSDHVVFEPVFKDEATALAALMFSFNRHPDTTLLCVTDDRGGLEKTYRLTTSDGINALFTIYNYRVSEEVEHL